MPASDAPRPRTRRGLRRRQRRQVVLVHGTLDESGSFRRAQDHLSRWSVTTYDRRGWGQSAPLGPAPLAQHAADLIDVLDGTRAEHRGRAQLRGDHRPDRGGRPAGPGHRGRGLRAAAALAALVAGAGTVGTDRPR